MPRLKRLSTTKFDLLVTLKLKTRAVSSNDSGFSVLLFEWKRVKLNKMQLFFVDTRFF
jgi:hypothetical protein